MSDLDLADIQARAARLALSTEDWLASDIAALDVPALIAELERLRVVVARVEALLLERSRDEIEDDPIWPWELAQILGD